MSATAAAGRRRRATFWGLIGVSAFVTPWAWRRVLALDRGGLATTIILGTNALGAALPIFGHSPLLLAVSALVFGVAFFAVVGSTTAFVRLNYPPVGMAHRDCGDDDRVRHRPDAGPDRGRRDHGRGGKSVLRAQRIGRDARARRVLLFRGAAYQRKRGRIKWRNSSCSH